MCAVSRVHDYFRDEVPLDLWSRDTFEQAKQAIEKLGLVDEALNQPDCEEPEKADWMQRVEERLQELEARQNAGKKH